jgi:hypothetical protein
MILIAIMVIGIASLIARLRSASGIERQQLRWLASALVLMIAGVFGGFVASSLLPDLADTGVVWIGAIVGFPSLALAIGVAILRYRLYEIDRIVSRTVSWLILTALLVIVFAGVVIALQWLLTPITEQNTLAVAASTLVAAALFQPLRGRVQGVVDGRFNRSRVDAERVTVALAATLRDEVALDEVERSLTHAVAMSLHPTTAVVWLRGAGT